jgi:hypothetical protein
MHRMPLVKPKIDIGAIERDNAFPIAAAYWQDAQSIGDMARGDTYIYRMT